MSVKRLKQKVAAALIVAMTATNILSAAAAPVGTPSKKDAVKVTFLGGEGGTWDKGIASKSTASKSSAKVATWSNKDRLTQIERTYIVEKPEWEDDNGSYVNKEYTKEFKNGGDWEKVTREGYSVVGWYDENNVYIGDDTAIYDEAKLTAKWQSDKVEKPQITSEVIDDGKVVVAGLEDNQQFILQDIDDDSAPEADKELVDNVFTKKKSTLKVYRPEDIVKLEINVKNHKTGQKVTVTLPIPKKLQPKSGEKYEIKAVHFKNEDLKAEEAEIIDITTDSDWDYMTFDVTGFSPFYFVKAQVEDKPDTQPDVPDEVKVTIENVENGCVMAYTQTQEGIMKFLPIGEEVTIPKADQPVYLESYEYWFDNADWHGEFEQIEAIFSEEGKEPQKLSQYDPNYITGDCKIVATFGQQTEEDDDNWYRDFIPVLEPGFVSQEGKDYTGTVVKLRKYNKETGEYENVPNGEWSIRPTTADELKEECGSYGDSIVDNLDYFNFNAETKTLTSKAPLEMGYYQYPVTITYQGEDYSCYSRSIDNGYGRPYTITVQVGANVDFLHGLVTLDGSYDWDTSVGVGIKSVSYEETLTWGIAKPKPEENLYDGKLPQMYNYEFKGWQSPSGVEYKADAQKVESLYEEGNDFEVYTVFEKEDGTRYAPKALGYEKEKEPNPSDDHKPSSSGGGGGHSSSAAKDYTMHGSWIADGNGWKFRKDSGEYATNTWGLINGKWYFFDAQGNMVTGWYQVSGQWYYMNPAAGAGQGAMMTGWVLDPAYNGWFYLTASGAMATGWQQINGVWYYLNPVSDGTRGIMAANTYVDGYYVNADGAWVQ